MDAFKSLGQHRNQEKCDNILNKNKELGRVRCRLDGGQLKTANDGFLSLASEPGQSPFSASARHKYGCSHTHTHSTACLEATLLVDVDGPGQPSFPSCERMKKKKKKIKKAARSPYAPSAARLRGIGTYIGHLRPELKKK